MTHPMPTDAAETVLIEISIDNWKKLNKIREDTQIGVDQNACASGEPRKVTMDDVIFDLTYGKY